MISQPQQFIAEPEARINHGEKQDQPIAEAIATLRMQEVIAKAAGLVMSRRAIPERRLRQGV